MESLWGLADRNQITFSDDRHSHKAYHDILAPPEQRLASRAASGLAKCVEWLTGAAGLVPARLSATVRNFYPEAAKMSITSYLDFEPAVGARAYLHESAQVIGDVRIGEHSSVWCNAVLRGDVNYIHIGRCTNIQDFSLGHVSHRNETIRKARR
jgi:UDP-3-O-[3-hydroxymyristoyl] glucosamine N-acyltransferase